MSVIIRAMLLTNRYHSYPIRSRIVEPVPVEILKKSVNSAIIRYNNKLYKAHYDQGQGNLPSFDPNIDLYKNSANDRTKYWVVKDYDFIVDKDSHFRGIPGDIHKFPPNLHPYEYRKGINSWVNVSGKYVPDTIFKKVKQGIVRFMYPSDFEKGIF